MAGTPIKAEKLASLDLHEEEILLALENGKTLQQIAKVMGVGRSTLMRWCSVETRAAKCSSARATAADALADSVQHEAAELVRDVRIGTAGRDDVAAVKLKHENDKWLAGVWNKDKYGAETKASVVVNLGVMHLDSLRQVMKGPTPAIDVEATEVQPAKPITLADLL